MTESTPHLGTAILCIGASVAFRQAIDQSRSSWLMLGPQENSDVSHHQTKHKSSWLEKHPKNYTPAIKHGNGKWTMFW